MACTSFIIGLLTHSNYGGVELLQNLLYLLIGVSCYVVATAISVVLVMWSNERTYLKKAKKDHRRIWMYLGIVGVAQCFVVPATLIAGGVSPLEKH